jgi:Amt family ammonium transporter
LLLLVSAFALLGFPIAVWAGVASYTLLKFVDAVVGLRVDEEEESSGLDIALHDEVGYNL